MSAPIAATRNVYEPHPLMKDHGIFWRCRHGKTGLVGPCWNCGIWHPIRWLRDVWYGGRTG